MKRNTGSVGFVGALVFHQVGWQYEFVYGKDLYPWKQIGIPVPCEFQFSIFFSTAVWLLLFLHALLPSSVLRVFCYFSLSVSMEMEIRRSEVEHLSTLT